MQQSKTLTLSHLSTINNILLVKKVEQHTKNYKYLVTEKVSEQNTEEQPSSENIEKQLQISNLQINVKKCNTTVANNSQIHKVYNIILRQPKTSLF